MAKKDFSLLSLSPPVSSVAEILVKLFSPVSAPSAGQKIGFDGLFSYMEELIPGIPRHDEERKFRSGFIAIIDASERRQIHRCPTFCSAEKIAIISRQAPRPPGTGSSASWTAAAQMVFIDTPRHP